MSAEGAHLRQQRATLIERHGFDARPASCRVSFGLRCGARFTDLARVSAGAAGKDGGR
jgi:hypothetical protein